MSRTSFVLSQLLPANPLPATELSLIIPRRGAKLRLGALGYGALLFVWSSVEDNHTLPVTLLGSGLGLLLLTLWITGRFGGRMLAGRSALLAAALFGAAAGLAAARATAAMMLLKDGLHAHAFPDYPFGMITAILARAPLWALAGIFAGMGLLLAWWGMKRKDVTQRREE